MRWILIIAVAVVGLLMQAGQARSEDEKECTRENARRVSFDDLWEITESPEPQCVRVRGISNGGSYLYRDSKAIYAENRIQHQSYINDVDDEPQLQKILIGVYGAWDDDDADDVVPADEDAGSYPYLNVDFTGWISRCSHVHAANEAAWEREKAAGYPNGMVFLMTIGICHHHTDVAYMSVTQHKLKPVHVQRLSGFEARRDFGTLTLISKGWRYHQDLVDDARLFFEAIRQGDREKLTELNRESELYGDDMEPSVLLSVSHRSVERFLNRGAGYDVALLIDENSDNSFAQDKKWYDFRGYACACVERSCRSRWPIQDMDTSVDEDRPYLCLRINAWRMSPKQDTFRISEASVSFAYQRRTE